MGIIVYLFIRFSKLDKLNFFAGKKIVCIFVQYSERVVLIRFLYLFFFLCISFETSELCAVKKKNNIVL